MLCMFVSCFIQSLFAEKEKELEQGEICIGVLVFPISELLSY